MSGKVIKKIGLFVFILAYSLVEAAEDMIVDVQSHYSFYQKQLIIGSVLVPIVAGGFVLVRNKEYAASFLEGRSVPRLMHTLTLEGQFEQCVAQCQVINNSSIMKQERDKINFIPAPDQNVSSSMIATNKIEKLNFKIKQLKQRLKMIKAYSANETLQGRCAEQLNKLMHSQSNLKKLYSSITNNPTYLEELRTHNNTRQTNCKEQKLTFSSKIAAFVPMFVQPVSTVCMVLLQMLFNTLGIE